MAKFFKQVREAVYGPERYSALLASKESGFGYFLKLVLLMAVLFTLAVGAWMYPIVRTLLDDVGAKAVAAYPAELVVKIRNGEISTNVKEPYRIPTPTDDAGGKPQYANIIVIDTKSESSLEALERADTYVLLTKTSVVVRDQRKGQVRIQSLGMLPGEEFELSYKTVRDFVEMVIPKLKMFSPIVLIFVFFGSVLSDVSLLLFALLGALFVLIVAMMKKLDLAYGRAYAMTLYLMTLPILVTSLMTIARMWTPMPRIPFLFTILLIIAASINLRAATVVHPRA